MLPVLAAGVLALVLAGCGVKGALEPPSRAAADGTAEIEGSREKVVVYSEKSAVRRVGSPSVLPKVPPEAWTKSREREQTEGPQQVERRRKTDEPFFLDWLL